MQRKVRRRNASRGGQRRKFKQLAIDSDELSQFPMKILVWNVRGMGGGQKTTVISKLIKEKNLDFFGVVETKHSNFHERKIKI